MLKKAQSSPYTHIHTILYTNRSHLSKVFFTFLQIFLPKYKKNIVFYPFKLFKNTKPLEILDKNGIFSLFKIPQAHSDKKRLPRYAAVRVEKLSTDCICSGNLKLNRLIEFFQSCIIETYINILILNSVCTFRLCKVCNNREVLVVCTRNLNIGF